MNAAGRDVATPILVSQPLRSEEDISANVGLYKPFHDRWACDNAPLPTAGPWNLSTHCGLARTHERSVKMAGLSEEDIRNRAYHLWKQAGEPAGAMDTLWYQAEAELLAERAEQGEVPPGMTDNLPV